MAKYGGTNGVARFAWCCALAVGTALCLLEPASSRAAPPAKPNACVVQRTEVRFSGAGYDHWVHVTNNCESRVACLVRTNVNSEGVRVTLAPKASESVLTWRGSPAREFTATVDCHYL